MTPRGWKHFLSRLRRLPLRLRRVLRGGTEGLHVSKIKGAGLTFVENRPYVPGDDPRAINWPLTARTGEPIIKIFESSRELIVWLIVDPSPSMFLGDPVSPIRWALEICGAAQATTAAGRDRLGRLDGRPSEQVAVRRGAGHLTGCPNGHVRRGGDTGPADADSVDVAGPVDLAAAGVGDDQHLTAGLVADGVQ